MAKQTINLVPEILDLVLYAGDGTNFRLVVKDGNGAIVNLTGTMIAQIRVSREEVDPPKAEFDIDLTDAVDGIAVLSLTGVQTHSLITGGAKFTGVWDVQWTPEGEEPVTILQGSVECVADVSH